MKNLETLCVQGGYEPKDGEARTLPICQSTTFPYKNPEDMAALFNLTKAGNFYSRIGNPTNDALEKKITQLDGGVGALGTSSGQSATMNAILNVCSCGDHVISTSTIYGGTFNLLDVTLRRLGIDTTFVSPSATKEEIEKLIRPNTKVLFAETIANPALEVLDFAKFSEIGKKYGILFVVDNTLATPILCRPFDFGADIVIYSSTKYLEGHAGTIGGLIVDSGNFNFDGNPRYECMNVPDESYHGLVYTKDVGKSAFIIKARVQLMRDFGNIMSPFTAYLTHLGMETLHLRMKKHCENALSVAKAIKNHKNTEFIVYPGLEDDKNYANAQKYMKNGATGVVILGVKGGEEKALNFTRNLKLMKQVTHIADVRSCVLHPASTTHRQLSEKALVECGISKNLLRLSIGIENTEDIVEDITNALDNI